MNNRMSFKETMYEKKNNYQIEIKKKKIQYYREKKEEELKESDIDIKNKSEEIENYISNRLNNPIDMHPYIHGKKNSDNLVLRYFANPLSVSPYSKSTGEILCNIHLRSEGYNFDERCMGLLGYGVWCLVKSEYDKIPYMTNFEMDILKYKHIENFPSEIFDDIYSFTERYYDEGPWDDLINEIEKRIYDEEERVFHLEEENEKRREEYEYYERLREDKEKEQELYESCEDYMSESDSDSDF